VQETGPELGLAEVRPVATLARLALSDDELERMRTEMASILAQVATLSELDTSAIPPSASILPLDTVMGDDVARPSLDPAVVLANAPAHEDGQFRVPAILEE
jgi:aspartyl-tRNA(Asn)/glutamyl-tRNA(Gln) amidotransferase subunit C